MTLQMQGELKHKKCSKQPLPGPEGMTDNVRSVSSLTFSLPESGIGVLRQCCSDQ